MAGSTLGATQRAVIDSPSTYRVCSAGCQYSTIQSAVDAAQAAALPLPQIAQVVVEPGLYSENIYIGADGLGRVALVGQDRRSTVIRLDGAAETVKMVGGPNSVSNLTIINNGGGSALHLLNGNALGFAVPNDSVVQGVEFNCTGAGNCLWWETNTAIPDQARLEVRGVRIQCTNGFCLYDNDGGRVLIANAVIETPAGMATQITGGIGLNVNTGGSSDASVHVISDVIIRMTNPAGAASPATWNGINIGGATGSAQVFMSHAVVQLTDNGSSTAGAVNGIEVLATTSNSIVARCYDCDITVARVGLNGAFTRGASNSDNGATLRLIGGIYRASNGDGVNAVDIRRGSTGAVLLYGGIDSLTQSGAPAYASVVGAQSGTCTFVAATTCTATLPITEPDATYSLSVTAEAGALAYSVGSKTTTNFVITASGSNSNTVEWILRR